MGLVQSLTGVQMIPTRWQGVATWALGAEAVDFPAKLEFSRAAGISMDEFVNPSGLPMAEPARRIDLPHAISQNRLPIASGGDHERHRTDLSGTRCTSGGGGVACHMGGPRAGIRAPGQTPRGPSTRGTRPLTAKWSTVGRHFIGDVDEFNSPQDRTPRCCPAARPQARQVDSRGGGARVPQHDPTNHRCRRAPLPGGGSAQGIDPAIWPAPKAPAQVSALAHILETRFLDDNCLFFLTAQRSRRYSYFWRRCESGRCGVDSLNAAPMTAPVHWGLAQPHRAMEDV